jgi:hypothetical protein
MNTVIFALVLAVTAADPGSTADTPAVALRRYHEIERDLTEALRSEVRAQTPEARAVRCARCAICTGNWLPTRDWRRATS